MSLASKFRKEAGIASAQPAEKTASAVGTRKLRSDLTKLAERKQDLDTDSVLQKLWSEPVTANMLRKGQVKQASKVAEVAWKLPAHLREKIAGMSLDAITAFDPQKQASEGSTQINKIKRRA